MISNFTKIFLYPSNNSYLFYISQQITKRIELWTHARTHTSTVQCIYWRAYAHAYLYIWSNQAVVC